MTRIEIGITHEVVIKGDKSWIRLCIADDYDISPNDKTAGIIPNRVKDIDTAVAELSAKVNDQLLKVVTNTVETVNNFTN